MRRWIRNTMTMAVVLAAALVTLAAPASAGQATTHFRGEAVYTPGECGGRTSDWTLVISGELEGCWYTNIEEATEKPSGVYLEYGTEEFVGCLYDDGDEVACGSFTTTYKFTGKFAPDGTQLHGRCQHPIVEGTGDFEGVTGRMDFRDDVDTGIAHFRGHVSLP